MNILSSSFVLAHILFLNIIAQNSSANIDIRHIHYQAIKKFLTQYKRAFTTLEINARDGYYSLQIARDFSTSVCVMIEADSQNYPDIADKLLSSCKTQRYLNNIIFLNKTFTLDDLEHLSECEHFDVVLLNEWGSIENWEKRIDAILNLGDFLLIKSPNESTGYSHEECRMIQNYIISRGGMALESDSLYLISSNKRELRRKTWLLPKMHAHTYVIESTFTEKKLVKPVYWPPKTHQTTLWIPGINLLTFKMCNGAYPVEPTIKDGLLTLKSQSHTDWMINNMIIQGNKLAWIDVHDPSRQDGAPLKPTMFSEQTLEAHLQLLSLSNPQQIEHYFWYTLIRTPISRRALVSFYKPFLPTSSVVFDIQSDNEQLLNIYLGHAAKVICFDLSAGINSILKKKFENDVTFVNNKTMQHTIGKSTLDNMIVLYGRPQLCNIHLNECDTYTMLQNLTQPIPYLIFKFNKKQMHILEQTLLHLASIGYTQFNFSVREIPVLGLNTNIHIGSQEQWVTSYKLLQKIHRFIELDYDADNFWGYIYARC